jgi:MFS family permease
VRVFGDHADRRFRRLRLRLARDAAVFGSLSDYLGRRRVILAGLAVNVATCAAFLVANGVGLLFAGRVLQGVAVGVAIAIL